MSFVNQTSLPFDVYPPNAIIDGVACEPDVFVGALVRMESDIARNALADDESNANVLGIVEAKSGTTVCVIRFFGLSGEIYTGLDETKEYFLSDTDAGEMITTPPTASGHIVLKIGQPFSSTRFLFMKGSMYKRA